MKASSYHLMRKYWEELETYWNIMKIQNLKKSFPSRYCLKSFLIKIKKIIPGSFI